MINFFKKHKLSIITHLFCAFAMALFTIVSFSCKTYAYTIDNNGNLVGDNIINCPNYHDFQTSNQWDILGIGSISDYTSDYTISFTYQQSVSGNGGLFLIQSETPNAPSVDYPNLGNQLLRTYEYGYVGHNIYVEQIINSNEITMPYILLATRSRNSKKVINLVNVMLNKGNEALTWEPYGVWYSETNYDTLQNQLDTTNGLLDLQIDITKYGWLSYIDNLEYYVTGNYVQTFSFNDLKTNNYISNNATIDLYQMSLYQNPNYSYIKFDIYFQNSYANLDYFSANLFDISTKLGFNGVVSIYDTDSNSAVFNITDIASITYEDIIEKNSNFGDYIYNVVFEFASPDAATMIYSNSFYSRGYQTGYSYGSNVTTGYYTPIINDLNARISNLENDILSLNNTIDTLKELNAQYQQQLADNVGWSSLFFAFADTPFKVVSNVLGFELFGLNLFATFIGMITVFGVVYLLKKFL